MIKIYDKNEPIRMSMERALPIFLGEDADILVVNIDAFSEVIDLVEKTEIPIIFYGFDSEKSLRRKGHPVVPHFYRKNTAYFKLPGELTELARAYQNILSGKKIENKAMILVSKAGSKKNLIGTLLHDIHPGKYGCEKGLETAKKEFGITGTIEEVRVKLEALRDKKEDGFVKKMIGNKVIPGVFCDIEGTLLDNGSVNPNVFVWLEKYEESGLAVTLWSGGDLEEIQKILYAKNIVWPLVSKYDFAGCKVEIAIDDMVQKKFKDMYKIYPQKYVKT
ncbi:MAG: hypothetical protein AB1798_20765 [Spirochaetota bacterium]